MIFDTKSEICGLPAKQTGMFDIVLARIGTSGRVVMRKNDPACIEVEGAPKDLARSDKHMGFCALCEDFLGDHEAPAIRKYGQYALVAQILHGDQQIGFKRCPVCAKPGPNDALAHAIADQLANTDERIDPGLVGCTGLSKLGLACVCDSAD